MPKAYPCVLGSVSYLAVKGLDWNCVKPPKEGKNHLLLWLGKETPSETQVLPASPRALYPCALYLRCTFAIATETCGCDLTLFVKVL